MQSTERNEAIVDEILTRGVGEFVDPSGVFRSKLLKKLNGEYTKEIIIKFGVDTTRPDIHLGHAVVLHKLRALQDAGCKIIFLIGDFTTQIGDPTGKSKVRPEISQAEIEKNLKTYLDQVGKVLRVERDVNGNILHTKSFSWMRNSDWFVGVTDIAVDADKTVNIAVGNGTNVEVAANSFVGKAAVYETTRMQRSQLGHTDISGITLINFLSVLRRITHAQLIERDMFQDRINGGESLFMHEMMYPIVQALDSVMLAKIYNSCDLELGGTDQTFNLLMGRRVMEMSEQDPQAIMSMKLLVGTDGKEKMSKSLDNYIGIIDSADQMYGKVMSLPDAVMEEYFTLTTYTPKEKVVEMLAAIKKGTMNPRDVKMYLARQIVELYHGRDAGELAEKSFIGTFQKKGIPESIPEVVVKRQTSIAEALITANIIPSKSEFRRLIDAGAIKEGSEVKITDVNFKIEKDIVVKIGKHQFVRFVVE